MNIAEISDATSVLGKPDGWDDLKGVSCRPLPVRSTVDAAGSHVYQSAWAPTPDEIVAIAHGAHVVLTVWGRGHPPVSVDVEFPLST